MNFRITGLAGENMEYGTMLSTEYFIFVHTITFDFGAYREGVSKIKYYFN
jgi:hypothetical protein